MHPRFGDDLDTSQEDGLDPATLTAEIDAIVRAPHKPMSAERQIAGIHRALDRLMGLEPVAMPPAPANDDQPTEDEDGSTPAIVSPTGEPLAEPTAPPSNDPRPLAGNPKKRAARPRTSQARDRRVLQRLPTINSNARPETRRQDAGPFSVRPLPTSHPLSDPIQDTNNQQTQSAITKASKSTEKRRKADENDTRRAPAWDRTTDLAKGSCYLRSVSPIRDGLACSLNLGGKVLKAANDDPKAFKDWMHDRLVKGFKASPLGARDFVSALELTRPAGRIHLHMAVDATENEIPAVEAVLAKAGGTWGAAAHADRQADARVMWGPAGWGRYMLKDHTHTKAALGIKSVFSVTRGCRARAEALWRGIAAAA